MVGLVNRYAEDLLSYANERNRLEDFYTQALVLTQRTDWSGLTSVPEDLEEFLKLVPETDLKAVLQKFIDISGSHLGLLDVTVISAVPLSDVQKSDLENKLVRIFKKQVHMLTKIDTSLLGGLRIVAGHTIIDNTIKKKLSDLKKRVYKGVYLE